DPRECLRNNAVINRAVEEMNKGFCDVSFRKIGDSLANCDPYMVLADFDSYDRARKEAERRYCDPIGWQHMGLINTANAGRFAADRAIREYARNIWKASPIPEEKLSKKTLFRK
ncbi:MAG: glycogen/starch/alpha-glucan phosphorylase, partial [Clostridiales bacterium]|nr:glycogen/starch/alpha-glucan phosphorylase [Clostridiales bacterium]